MNTGVSRFRESLLDPTAFPRKDLPVNTLSEFVAYAKANKGKMQYGSAGAGSGMHVCAVLLDAAMGTKLSLIHI